MDEDGVDLPTSEWYEIKASGKFKQLILYSDDEIFICTNQDADKKTAKSKFKWPKNTFYTIDKDDTEAFEKKYQKAFKSIFIISATGTIGKKLYYQFVTW